MMPNQMPPQGAGAPPMGGPPAPSGGGKPSPEQMKTTLLNVLKEVFRVAEQNGINPQELISQAMKGGGSTPPPPAPRP